MRKPYHHVNLRRAVLDACRAGLAQGTESALSLRDLATRVGVSVDATYRHFNDKEVLLMELAAEGLEVLRDGMLRAVAASNDERAAERPRVAGETPVLLRSGRRRSFD